MPSSIDLKRERVVEAYLKKRVKETGGRTRKVRWLCQNGAPDRLVWWAFPCAAFVETKAARQKPEPGSPQDREIKELRASGWKVYVIDTREGVERFIAEMTGYGIDPIDRIG